MIKMENVRHAKKDLSFLHQDAGRTFLSALNFHKTTLNALVVSKDTISTKDGARR